MGASGPPREAPVPRLVGSGPATAPAPDQLASDRLAPDQLASGPSRRPVPGRTRALLLAALVVAGAGAVSVPSVRAASAPPVITATTSGGASGGRLRVWLLLEGPASARIAGVRAVVPGSGATAGVVPEAFSERGDAVVRVDVDPRCPQAVQGLGDAALQVRLEGEPAVRVPFDTDGPLAGGVRARCGGGGDAPRRRGPLVRAQAGGPAGALRTVVELGAPGPEVLVVRRVSPGPGVGVDVVTPLPLRVQPGMRGRLVVDLRPGRCALAPGEPPFVLDAAATGEVEPSVDAALQGRLDALRRSAC